jgi:hypothetical protein
MGLRPCARALPERRLPRLGVVGPRRVLSAPALTPLVPSVGLRAGKRPELVR